MAVANGDAVGLPRVGLGVRSPDEAGAGRRGHNGHAPAIGTWCGPGQLQGQDVGDRALDGLFGKGEGRGRQPARIERVAQGVDPAMVERVEQVRIDAGPIVNRHGLSLHCRIVPALGRGSRGAKSTRRPSPNGSTCNSPPSAPPPCHASLRFRASDQRFGFAAQVGDFDAFVPRHPGRGGQK